MFPPSEGDCNGDRGDPHALRPIDTSSNTPTNQHARFAMPLGRSRAVAFVGTNDCYVVLIRSIPAQTFNVI